MVLDASAGGLVDRLSGCRTRSPYRCSQPEVALSTWRDFEPGIRPLKIRAGVPLGMKGDEKTMRQLFKAVGLWVLRAALHETLRAVWEHVRDQRDN